MRFVAAAAKVAGHFAAQKRKNFVELVGGRDARIHDNFELRIHLSAFFKEAEGKSRAYAESILVIDATPGKHQLDFLPRRPFARDVRKEYGPAENFGGAFFVLAGDPQRKRRPSILFVAQFKFGEHRL